MKSDSRTALWTIPWASLALATITHTLLSWVPISAEPKIILGISVVITALAVIITGFCIAFQKHPEHKIYPFLLWMTAASSLGPWFSENIASQSVTAVCLVLMFFIYVHQCYKTYKKMFGSVALAALAIGATWYASSLLHDEKYWNMIIPFAVLFLAVIEAPKAWFEIKKSEPTLTP